MYSKCHHLEEFLFKLSTLCTSSSPIPPPRQSPLLTPLPSSESLINIIPLGKLWLKMKRCKVFQSLEKLNELLELIVCSVLIYYYFFFTHFCIKLIVEVPLKKLLRLSAFFFLSGYLSTCHCFTLCQSKSFLPQ